ncbi:RNA polymerase sigma factor [Calycomorphotria hydatis]|uniref:ECF RNA polymerase sigma factor SigH n=1 Tax=Calycomorphotria hydatis TaxID=2528027 RepID=A0A517TB75_9PLAN|nr:sigma-70 family RNA polymerase sigma factor [Calycomorphotria hydatis]QDT65616.1 ECF RNA polymerase sigma factor SigH [Calycomorphotria hydatis]
MHIHTSITSNDSSSQGQLVFLRLYTASYADIKRTLLVFLGNANDADDLMQETSLALWEQFSDYDHDRSFTAWACGIAANKAKKFLRDRYRKKNFGLSDEALVNLIKVRTGAAELYELRRDLLEDCLSHLSSVDRNMLWDCYADGVKAVAYAKAKETPVGTVTSRLHRLRKWLYDCVERRLANQESRKS